MDTNAEALYSLTNYVMIDVNGKDTQKRCVNTTRYYGLQGFHKLGAEENGFRAEKFGLHMFTRWHDLFMANNQNRRPH